jgi:hypothetical protein
MKSRRSTRQNASPRLRQTISWQYVAAGVAVAAIVVAIGVFIYLNMANNHDVKAAAAKPVITSNGSGNWDATASWSPRVPQSGDSIILRDGDEISIMENTEISDAHIGIYGTLLIDKAKKLHLQDGSRIEVFGPDGSIDEKNGTGNGAGTKITYNGETLWDSGMESIVSYSSLDQYGYNKVELLPVELAYFRAKMENNKAVIEWATASEMDNDYFTVERSADGSSFESIATIPGAGNSHSLLTYTYTDASPLAGTSYYRLTQTDFDQKFEIFKPISVAYEAKATNMLNLQSVGPNPFSSSFRVQFDLGTDGPVELRLMNMQGQLVATETIDGYAGSNHYEFQDNRGLMTGTYLLSLVQNNVASKGIRLIKK